MAGPGASQIITVDGPAASGKSSVARRIAERLGWNYVNSGNMYRAVTWAVMAKGIDPADEGAVAGVVRNLNIQFPLKNARLSVQIGGRELADELTSAGVNRNVSLVARVPEVRECLVAAQRSLCDQGPIVMEGRDIGSVVFPDAKHKFYIDASEEVRARRRREQGHADSIGERDRLDSTRKNSPLVVAGDAVVIDSSEMTLDEVVEAVMQVLRSRGVEPLAPT